MSGKARIVPLLRLGRWLVLALAMPITAAAAVHTVTNTNDSGPGSLRQALLDADTDPGGTVVFSIGSGIKKIRPLSGLSASTAIVDGTTQPGYAGAPLIEIDGSLLPSVTTCVALAGTSVLKAVAVGSCSYRAVFLSGAAKILGSFIGTDPTGQFARMNGAGVTVRRTGAGTPPTIGGTAPGEGNLISGNGYGVDLGAPALVVGNRIGTNVSGTAAVPNLLDGIFVAYAPSPVIIGGTTPGSGNLISGNGQYGIEIFNSHDVIVQGNTIGPDALGQGTFSNQRAGVAIYSSSRAVVGGSGGAANVIAFHSFAGIAVVFGANRNTFTRNSLFSNAFGIDLDFQLNSPGSRVTPNDPCDTDTGPNLLLNYPVLTQAAQIGGQVRIDGTLNSEPDASYTLEFFASPSCNASGNGEGKTYLGAVPVTTDSSCNARVAGLFVANLSPGSVITATSTDTFGNTSEFSPCVPVTAGPTVFYTVTPCRVLDTREPVGPYGGPAFNAGEDRSFVLAGQCGIPAMATAVSLNVAVTQPTAGPGFLTLRPGGSVLPLSPTLNYGAGQTRSNNAIMPLGGLGAIAIYCGQGSGTAHVIVDVIGYFQ